ncbi:hypothetical protein [Flavobacterium sp.]|jgi:hypothetical protein|uniref:hypothetical protein n=1 Tax=Flavobacterium sp. TaxID=239 RepID=UPI0037BFB880
MNLKKYQPILEVIFLSILIYLVHKLVFFLNENHPKLHGFHFPIEVVYGFFFSCSLILMLILIKVKEKNIDNVGYTFLLVTCVKMGLSYLLLSPILNSENANLRYEKINFFLIFAFFLALETVVTIRMLNNKP